MILKTLKVLKNINNDINNDKVQKNSQPAVFVSAIETLAEEIWKNV